MKIQIDGHTLEVPGETPPPIVQWRGNLYVLGVLAGAPTYSEVPCVQAIEPPVPGTMTCPRRSEDGMDDPAGPFKRAGTMLDRWREDGTCSYCGSLEPEDVLKQLAAGVEALPTDKNYKLYLRSGPHGQAKFYFQHFDKPQCLRFLDIYNGGTMKLGLPGHFYVRPFFFAPKGP